MKMLSGLSYGEKWKMFSCLGSENIFKDWKMLKMCIDPMSTQILVVHKYLYYLESFFLTIDF